MLSFQTLAGYFRRKFVTLLVGAMATRTITHGRCKGNRSSAHHAHNKSDYTVNKVTHTATIQQTNLPNKSRATYVVFSAHSLSQLSGFSSLEPFCDNFCGIKQNSNQISNMTEALKPDPSLPYPNLLGALMLILPAK